MKTSTKVMEKKQKKLLEEGYKQMAGEHLEFAKTVFPLQEYYDANTIKRKDQ